MSELVLGMALIAVVLLVSALASGIVERAPLSFPTRVARSGIQESSDQRLDSRSSYGPPGMTLTPR